MIYLFEKDVGLPLCAYKDNNYINLFTGEIITEPNKLEFMEKYLKSKKIYKQEAKVEIMKLKDTKNNEIIGYAYVINDIFYFLDTDLKLFDRKSYEFINGKLANDKYMLETVWK